MFGHTTLQFHQSLLRFSINILPGSYYHNYQLVLIPYILFFFNSSKYLHFFVDVSVLNSRLGCMNDLIILLLIQSSVRSLANAGSLYWTHLLNMLLLYIITIRDFYGRIINHTCTQRQQRWRSPSHLGQGWSWGRGSCSIAREKENWFGAMVQSEANQNWKTPLFGLKPWSQAFYIII